MNIRAALDAYRKQALISYGATNREIEVALGIAAGKTFGTIAEELFISERTVKFHSKNLYTKLGISSKKELLRFFDSLERESSRS